MAMKMYVRHMNYLQFCIFLLQEQDSSYTIIKSKETEMVVEGLKPSSAYIFQVKHGFKKSKLSLINNVRTKRKLKQNKICWNGKRHFSVV